MENPGSWTVHVQISGGMESERSLFCSFKHNHTLYTAVETSHKSAPYR